MLGTVLTADGDITESLCVLGPAKTAYIDAPTNTNFPAQGLSSELSLTSSALNKHGLFALNRIVNLSQQNEVHIRNESQYTTHVHYMINHWVSKSSLCAKCHKDVNCY